MRRPYPAGGTPVYCSIARPQEPTHPRRVRTRGSDSTEDRCGITASSGPSNRIERALRPAGNYYLDAKTFATALAEIAARSLATLRCGHVSLAGPAKMIVNIG